MNNCILHTIDAPLYQIRTFFYILETEKHLFFIDSGVLSARTLVEEKLSAIGCAGKTLILITTHEHWDHTGLAGYLRERGALAAAHVNGRRMLCDKDFHWRSFFEAFLSECPPSDEKRSSFYRDAADGCPHDLYLRGGESFSGGGVELEIIHTPGHSGGSVCVYERKNRVLFSGDAVQGNGFFGSIPFYSDAAAYEKSIRSLCAYDIETIYGGHGVVSGRQNAARFLRESLDAVKRVECAVLSAYRSCEPRTATLSGLAEKVAGSLGVSLNYQVFYTLDAHLRRMREGYEVLEESV